MTTTPHRITRWQWTRARIAILIGLEPHHHGATADWAQQLRTIPAARLDRQPIAQITATPHWEACDELGPWNPSQHPLQPAHIHAALTGGTA